jgi:hypothetical protein
MHVWRWRLCDRLRVTSRPSDRTARAAANYCISAVVAALPSSATILDDGALAM